MEGDLGGRCGLWECGAIAMEGDRGAGAWLGKGRARTEWGPKG